MSDSGRVAYDFAVLRVVPHVHLGAFEAVGVIVHARTAEFLGMRALTDPAVVRARFPGLDHELLLRYLHTFEGICAGDPAAGPVALDPVSERFHWLTAPRSDVLQTSPIHEGLCGDPGRALDMLYEEYVMEGRPPSPTR
ncbi:DUF3037 domain-containing protein [soil metagenome]